MVVLTKDEQKKWAALSKLFWAFPAGVGINRGEKSQAYLKALSRITPGLVEAACDAAIKGKIGNPTFLPSAAEIYQYAEELHVKILRAAAEDKRPWVKIPDPPRVAMEFDPAAKTFSPYKLGLTQEQITRCVMAYRRGEDWKPIYQEAVKANDRLGENWIKLASTKVVKGWASNYD